MTQPNIPQKFALPFSRPLPEDAAPICMGLRFRDGYETSVYVHLPPDDIAAGKPVLYVHGIQSHPGWFVGSAAHLARNGFPVFQLTRRGSGDNDVLRGHAEDSAQMLADIVDACGFVRDQTGAGKLHLLGVSWGGKLLAAFSTVPQYRDEIASLTMVAPGICPKVDVPFKTKLSIAASLLFCPKKLFDIPLDDETLFTKNPAMLEYLRADERRLRKVTAAFLFASRRLDMLLARQKTGCLGMPISLILSHTDDIIDNLATRSVVEKLTGGRAEVIELPGMHTLEFQADPSAYFDTLTSVLVRHN